MQNLLNSGSQLAANWVDLIFFIVLLYFVFTNKGFINTFFEIIGFIVSLFLSYRLYPVVGRLLTHQFGVSRGIAQAFGFFASWFVIETLFYFLIMLIFYRYIKKILPTKIDETLGYVVGAFQGAMFFLFFVSLVFALPVRGNIKQTILESRSGPFFVNLSQASERSIKNIFGDVLSETLNFLTVKPDSHSTVDLGVKADKGSLSVDISSEDILFDLVNRERVQRGMHQLTKDERLQYVARVYAKEMFENGFFSHVSAIDGSTASDRVTRAGISYQIVGENLAFAPDVYLAHQGLMNSKGHRENILLADYAHVGIGVIDGGVYGKMFVQLFKD